MAITAALSLEVAVLPAVLSCNQEAGFVHQSTKFHHNSLMHG